jgi:hypothetical protein
MPLPSSQIKLAAVPHPSAISSMLPADLTRCCVALVISGMLLWLGHGPHNSESAQWPLTW